METEEKTLPQQWRDEAIAQSIENAKQEKTEEKLENAE